VQSQCESNQLIFPYKIFDDAAGLYYNTDASSQKTYSGKAETSLPQDRFHISGNEINTRGLGGCSGKDRQITRTGVFFCEQTKQAECLLFGKKGQSASV
jgi:hypothetical protein